MSTTAPEAPRAYAPADLPQIHRRRTAQPRVVRRPRGRSKRERIESLIIFLVFGGLAFALGYHVLTVNKVVVFDGLDRLTRAFMVLWDAPPKLAAIGFSTPPLPSLMYVPFAAVKPLASSLTALPLCSAVFFGGVMVLLGRLLVRCELPLLARIALLVLFAVNPMWAFYGSNGAPDIVYLFFLALALYSFVSWYRGQETLYLIGAGTSMALCMLTRYGFISMAVLVAFLFGAALWRRGADHDEVEGSVIAYLAPVVYAFALWTLLNFAIIGSPFRWLSTPASTLAVNSDQISTLGHYDLGTVANHMLSVVVGAGPMALVALPLLMVGLLRRRDALCFWLAGMLALTVVLVGSEAVRAGDVGRIVLKNGLPVELVAFVSMAWLYSIAGRFRLPVLIATIAALVIALPLAWNAMLSYPFQNMEQAFIHAARSPGTDLSGTASRGGYTVGLRSELAMADEIKRVVGTRTHSILTDNSQTYAVITLTGRPNVFIDRSQRGDGPWRRLLNHPFGRVRYMLIASQAPSDLIRTAYPSAARGADPQLTPIFTTPRYTLVRVASQAPPASTTTGQSSRPATAQTTSGSKP